MAQVIPGLGQDDLALVAPEQALPECGFNPPDPVADRRGGHAKFIRRKRKAEMRLQTILLVLQTCNVTHVQPLVR